MREIDEVRITLLRLFRKGAPGTAVAHHTPTHSLYGENEGLWPPNTIDFQLWPMVPQVIIKLINGILRGRPVDSHQERVHASIKLQAYGRGLLQRFRSHRLITKDFNRQASREYQEYLTAWQGFNNPAGYLDDMRHPFLHGYRFARDHEIDISQDMEGISAKWHTRAHRESRKALAYRIRRAHRWQDKFAAPYSMHGVFGWLEPRLSRFIKARLTWSAHRSRLGVKVLDFSSN